MRSKRNLVLSIVVLGLVLTIGVSYAWFSGVIFGDSKQISINAKELKIIFTDSDILANEEITPGWSNSKTFSVKNESNGTFNYNITIKGLVNTFVTEGFFKYKITSTNGGYNMENYVDIPKSDTAQDVVIAYDIDIEKDVTQEYQIEFIYEDSETIDQSEDMGKVFNGILAIEVGTINPNIKYSVTLNAANTIIDNNTKETIKRGSVEFNVVPDEGYTLGTNVTCDNEAIGRVENGVVTISNVTANTICSLNNDINTYTIEMKVVNGKSNALNKIIPYNGSDSFTITPNTGYTLTGATLTGEGCTIENNIVTVSNVKFNGTCTLTLVKEKYQVILTGSNVTVSDSPKQVEYEGSTTFNVSPSTGFTMSEATVNCDGGANTEINGNTVTISNVLKGQTCTITPKQLTYDVTLVVVNGSGNTTKSIAHGGSDTFNISATSTYTLESPTISCTGSASTSYTNGVLTVSNVTGSQTCTVTLKHTSYTVIVTSNNNNYGTVSPTSQYIVHGNSATITLNSKPGYKYSSNTCGGTIDGNTMTINNITSDKTCNITFEYTGAINQKLFTYLSNGETYEIGTRTDFSTVFGGEEIIQGYNQTGKIYLAENNYYFAGNPSDNWVKFAGFWWRIIRTNSNEGTRLLYAGTKHDGQDGYINNTTYKWYTSSDNADYVKWSYAANSIGNALTDWYNTNITGTNANMVNTNVAYCNDTSQARTSGSNIYYGAYGRLQTKKSPSYSCVTNSNFSHSKIGLMTADEVAYAGGVFNSFSLNTYFYRNSISNDCTDINSPCSVTGNNYWWTMSPENFLSNSAHIYYIQIYYGPRITYTNVNNDHVVRPVITLKPTVLVSGSGTTDDPFIPTIN